MSLFRSKCNGGAPREPDEMVVVITGVAGAGKSTVGRALADELGWAFVDADDLHAPASIEKMRSGVGLSDAERWPWLERVRTAISAASHDRPHVVACSALRERHRRFLAEGTLDVRFVFLEGTPALLEERLRQRTGHFASVALLSSQLEALEPPGREVFTLDAALPVDVLVRRIVQSLRLPPARPIS